MCNRVNPRLKFCSLQLLGDFASHALVNRVASMRFLLMQNQPMYGICARGQRKPGSLYKS